MIRARVLVPVTLLALTAPMAAQAPQKKFMAAPVTIEDQGSFFIGGVTKVTEHAAIPFAPPVTTADFDWKENSIQQPVCYTPVLRGRAPSSVCRERRHRSRSF